MRPYLLYISGIKNFINRRFKKLESYINLEDENNQASRVEISSVVKDDVILGVYRNGDAVSKMFFISQKGIYCREKTPAEGRG